MSGTPDREPCNIEPAFSQHEYVVDYCETHDQPADQCDTPDRERLAALLDPENAPARHGEWRPAHRPMGEESVELVDDDGCSLWVELWEVAVMVNMAVDRAAGVHPAAPSLDVEALARFLHERICDRRSSHDATLGRCYEFAREYQRITGQ